MYSQHDDMYLLTLLKDGDDKAFSELYTRYWDKLFYVGGKKLRDLQEAENIVQEIFLDLWNRRLQLDITGTLSHYLAVALKYKIINFQARTARHILPSQTIDAEDHSTSQWLNFQELKGRLDRLVTQLPEKCRLAYALREEGLSQKEIAQEMGVSENTVESHIKKALKFLRSGLMRLFLWLL
ncbi:MAG: RNA polymerase sigma-70 factor [Chitinophagaceae bacterium]